jgi:hypothetical protein
MSTDNPPEPKEKLPVREILLQSIRAPWEHRYALLRVAYPMLVVPLVFYGAIFVLGILSGDAAENGTAYGPLLIGLAALGVVAFLGSTLIAAVGAHRIFVLGPAAAPDFRLAWVGKGEIRFLGWLLLLPLGPSLTLMPIYFILGPFALGANMPLIYLGSINAVIGLIFVYLMSRFAFVFPAAATDFRPELEMGWAWRLSGHNHWRCFLLFGLIPIATSALLQLLPAYDSILYDTFLIVLGVLVLTVELALLSFSFRWMLDYGQRLASADT